MKVALIPARGLENYALLSRFHLALAIPELMARRPYSGMYKRAIRLGDYVVLDNGAAEDRTADEFTLCQAAEDLACQELVLPDVMCRMQQTINAVTRFLTSHPNGMLKMAVVQGTLMNDLRSCISRYTEMPGIDVVGLPRHLVTTTERASTRIDLANWIEKTYPGRFQIHLLGTNPAWLKEVAAAAKYAAHIRSVDTSLPFNYALAGKTLRDTDVQITRPEGYFNQDWSGRIDARILRDNIQFLMESANAKPREELPSGEEARAGSL